MGIKKELCLINYNNQIKSKIKLHFQWYDV